MPQCVWSDQILRGLHSLSIPLFELQRPNLSLACKQLPLSHLTDPLI